MTNRITIKRTRDIYGEYRLRLYIDGQYQPGADYYTDDLDDARATSAHMARHAVPSDPTTDFARDEAREESEVSR